MGTLDFLLTRVNVTHFFVVFYFTSLFSFFAFSDVEKFKDEHAKHLEIWNIMAHGLSYFLSITVGNRLKLNNFFFDFDKIFMRFV